MISPGIVTGLTGEAQCLIRAGHVNVLCHGPGSRHAQSAARTLLERGARGLVSFGLAGGLDPDLPPGTLILADRVIGGTSSFPTDSVWREALAARLAPLSPLIRPLADGGIVLVSAADKRALFESSGAVAVDMESATVARLAGEAGVPFVVVRAIADPASRSLPFAALAGMGEDGNVRPFAALAALLRHPGQIPALIGLARDSAAAMATLRRAAGIVGLEFGSYSASST